MANKIGSGPRLGDLKEKIGSWEKVQNPKAVFGSVRKVIAPVSKASSYVKVGNDVVFGDEGVSLWVNFFREQVSLSGPLSPQDILKHSREENALQASPSGGHIIMGADGDGCTVEGAVSSDNEGVELESVSDSAHSSASSSGDGSHDTSHEVADDDDDDDDHDVELNGLANDVTNTGVMHGFNDSALESQQEKVSELLELCEERSRNGQGAQPFSFVELCEVQRKINTRAAVSPLSCVPLALLASVGEAIRITLLCLFNVVFSWRVFPMTWGIIPVVPVPKPGKDKQLIENHRQVSLFESMFKLLDKLLYYRVKFRVNPFLQPWQMGAGVGSDQAAWVLDQILRIRARSFNGVRTWLGFLDGESAFCRPPPAFILTALWECGVNDEVWLFLHQWLGSTFATLLLVRGEDAWEVMCPNSRCWPIIPRASNSCILPSACIQNASFWPLDCAKIRKGKRGVNALVC